MTWYTSWRYNRFCDIRIAHFPSPFKWVQLFYWLFSAALYISDTRCEEQKCLHHAVTWYFGYISHLYRPVHYSVLTIVVIGCANHSTTKTNRLHNSVKFIDSKFLTSSQKKWSNFESSAPKSSPLPLPSPFTVHHHIEMVDQNTNGKQPLKWVIQNIQGLTVDQSTFRHRHLLNL